MKYIWNKICRACELLIVWAACDEYREQYKKNEDRLKKYEEGMDHGW